VHVERVRHYEPVAFGFVAIPDRRAAGADAARIEADDVVEAAERRERERRRLDDEVDARKARPAGVDEERSDPVLAVAGRAPDQRQLDRGAVRPRVVPRDLRRRAFEAGVAGSPVELWNGVGVRRRRGGKEKSDAHDKGQQLRQHGRSPHTDA